MLSAQEIACDDDTYAIQSLVTALVDASRPYLVAVTGWNADNPAGELAIVAFFQTNTRWQAPPGVGLPKRLHPHTATTDGTDFFLIGGQDSQYPCLSSRVCRYQLDTATWHALQKIASPYSNSDGAYFDGHIYLPSGYAGGQSLQPYECIHYTYLISDDALMISEPMASAGAISEPVAWDAVTADPDRGFYFYTGGRCGTDPGKPLPYIFEYNAAGDSCRILPPMTTPRYAHEAVYIAGRLCVTGGSISRPIQ